MCNENIWPPAEGRGCINVQIPDGQTEIHISLDQSDTLISDLEGTLLVCIAGTDKQEMTR